MRHRIGRRQVEKNRAALAEAEVLWQSGKKTEAASVGLECPSCHQAFVAKQIGEISGLKALGMGIDSVSGDPNHEVEFVVPAPE